MARSTRMLCLCGGLAIVASAALSAVAGDVSYVFNALSVGPMLYIAPIVSVLVMGAAFSFGRHLSFASFQIALATVLLARDRAFKDRVMQRVADRRPVRLAVQF